MADRRGGTVTRVLALGALAAPFVFAIPQRVLIPSWYEASLYVADALLVLNVVAVAILIVRALRRHAWRWLTRASAGLGLLLLAAAAAIVTWDGATREGIFVCGRELEETVACPGGGQAFEFVSLCIAGNPRTEVTVRPNAMPFMHPVTEASAADACAALAR